MYKKRNRGITLVIFSDTRNTVCKCLFYLNTKCYRTSSLSDNMLLSAIGVLFISSVALCAPSDAVEVGVCNGDGCSALKSSIGAIEVILARN